MLSRLASKGDKGSATNTVSSSGRRATNPNKESSQVLRMSSQITQNQNTGESARLKWNEELSEISEVTLPSERTCDGWLKEKMGIKKKHVEVPAAGGASYD